MSKTKFIELIRVRSSSAELGTVAPGLQQIVTDIGESKSPAETFILQHALYDGDLAVVIVWPNAKLPETTREGLLVADFLARIGSVEHAVWIPTEMRQN